MKKYIGILCVLALFAGCNKEQQNPDEGDCLVSISFGGEITTSDAPLTKASTTDDLYLVQVYRGGNHFACGVVDAPDRISLNLKKGTDKYRIIVSMLRNGKTRLGDKYSSANKSYQSLPSSNSKSGCFGRYDSSNSRFFPVNHLYYNSVKNYTYYSSSSSTSLQTYDNSYDNFPKIENGDLYGEKYPSCDDWFYGEINNYSPTGSYETLSMELKRVGFQLKYELSGITDGEVTVELYNSTKTFVDKKISSSTFSSTPQFFAFYDLKGAWEHANDYMENFTLSVSWLRGIGITEDYGTKTIQLKRNCMNNIRISMGNNDQNAGMSVTAEAESTIGSESVTIPVQ